MVSSYNPWRPNADVMESGLGILQGKNSELTYEKKHELNLGIDLGFLDNVSTSAWIGTNARTMT